MNVLQINKRYYPHVGGVENHVRILSTGLKNRADVRILCANEGPRTVVDTVDGLTVTRLANWYDRLSAPMAPSFITRLPDSRCDIHHVHFPSGLPEVALASRGVGKPIVVTYHSDIVRQKYLEKAFRPFAAKLLEKASRIIVGSPNLIHSSRLLGDAKEKCAVIPFGIDESGLEGTPEVMARVSRIRDSYDGKLVFFLGRLIYYKGVEHLIKAMQEIEGTLLIGGTGPLEGELKALARDLLVDAKVVFLGSISKEDHPAYYHACDVFALPSVAESEAYGLVQVEAHMCGKPVVSTDLPTGVPFVNQHEITGLVVPPGDDRALAEAINRLFEDDALRLRLGTQAKKRALAEFTASRMVDRTFELYTDLMEGRS
ncbi:MAG: glycosyltransferase [Chloroflexi bacterium]|nr:glycosyltransferase [Chloroflexota bacterium]